MAISRVGASRGAAKALPGLSGMEAVCRLPTTVVQSRQNRPRADPPKGPRHGGAPL